MNLSNLDWGIIISYLILSLGLGVYFARKGSKSFLDFMLSGRQLPWWLAGTSIVATTFSVDTPIYVTELVRSQGISGNWQWWCFGIGGAMGMLAIVLFASRWRRAGIVTEVEFVELRYGGKSAAVLRAVKAFYFALIKNSLALAALLVAMATMLKVILDIPYQISLYIASGIALLYTLLSGLWGVVVADFLQFILGMAGSIVLAVYVVGEIGGIAALKSALFAADQQAKLAIFPPQEGGITPLLFFVYLGFLWWTNINADGGGIFVQRMAASKDERQAALGSLWAVFAHYVLRSWPWIVTALASLVILPKVADRDAYPMLMNDYLPTGMKGFMVVALLAAFMSTISTLLNWGASILVHDGYRRFIYARGGEQHYVQVSRLATLLLLLIPWFFLEETTGVRETIEKILELGAGYGPVLLLRWFWWRINAWSEIAAIVASILIALAWFYFPFSSESLQIWQQSLSAYDWLAIKLLGTTIISAIFWLPATFLSQPTTQPILEKFVHLIQPVGFWQAVNGYKYRGGWCEFRCWVIGVLFLFVALFAVGDLVLWNTNGLAYMGSAAIFLGWLLYREFNRLFAKP